MERPISHLATEHSVELDPVSMEFPMAASKLYALTVLTMGSTIEGIKMDPTEAVKTRGEINTVSLLLQKFGVMA